MNNLFQEHQNKQKRKRIIEALILGLTIFLVVIAVVSASAGSLEDKLIKEVRLSVDHQEHLHGQAQGIRSELNVLEARVAVLKEELAQVQAIWNFENGKIDSMNIVIEGLEKEPQLQ